MQNKQAYKIRISPIRVAFFILALIAIYYLAPQLGDIKAIFKLLVNSSWIWLILATLSMLLGFYVGAVIQYAAGDSEGSVPDIIQLGFAGSLLNHFLPYSIGGIGLTAEYYNKLGHSKARSIIMATIPIAVGSVTTALILLIISPLTFMEIAQKFNDLKYEADIVVPIIVLCLAVIVILVYYSREKIKGAISEVIRGLVSMRNFKQIIKVSGWSVIMSLVASFTLYASVKAIYVDIDFVVVMAIFIGSMLISEVTPTPGGIGATEAVIVLGLTGAGLSPSQALSATLIFRFISFILPLIPGAVAVSQLNRPLRR